jgi:hypothetical protein
LVILVSFIIKKVREKMAQKEWKRDVRNQDPCCNSVSKVLCFDPFLASAASLSDSVPSSSSELP